MNERARRVNVQWTFKRMNRFSGWDGIQIFIALSGDNKMDFTVSPAHYTITTSNHYNISSLLTDLQRY